MPGLPVGHHHLGRGAGRHETSEPGMALRPGEVRLPGGPRRADFVVGVGQKVASLGIHAAGPGEKKKKKKKKRETHTTYRAGIHQPKFWVAMNGFWAKLEFCFCLFL